MLEEYLKAWFPIMGKCNGRILFVDGFAGPGEYEGGEMGSPVVAMKVLADHAATIKAEVVFVFIEKERDRAEHLQGLVDQWRPRLSKRTEISVLTDEFESVKTKVREDLDATNVQMAPALVMADPFGVKGIPLDVFQGIFENQKCEVYVSFMWRDMNRFLGAPEFQASLDALFGTDEWRDAQGLIGNERRFFLYDLYRRQLKSAGAKQ